MEFDSTSGGNGGPERHSKQHTSEPVEYIALPVPCQDLQKNEIAKDSALAVTLDIRPL